MRVYNLCSFRPSHSKHEHRNRSCSFQSILANREHDTRRTTRSHNCETTKASIATPTSAGAWLKITFDPSSHLNSGRCNEGREFLFVPLLDGHVRIPVTLRRARSRQASASRRTGCPATAAVFASSEPADSALLACRCLARSLFGEFLGVGVEYETSGVFGTQPDINFHQWTPAVAGMRPLLEQRGGDACEGHGESRARRRMASLERRR